MSLRSVRERVIQTLCFELGGLLMVSPLYAHLLGASMTESVTLLVVLAVVMLLWSPLHNTVFDRAELRLAGRSASDRPQGWRLVHALSHEATALIVTVPIVMHLGDLGFWSAIVVDLGLTATYVVYAYVFHLAFDHLRPVARPGPAALPA